MNYLLLKQVHIAFAVVSLTGYAMRWSWRSAGSVLARHRLTRIVTHLVDTLFLLTGVLLIITTAQYPWNTAWLAAKLCGLLVYILLGMAAMSARSGRLRLAAFISAVSVFAWIGSAALLKSPWGFLQSPG